MTSSQVPASALQFIFCLGRSATGGFEGCPGSSLSVVTPEPLPLWSACIWDALVCPVHCSALTVSSLALIFPFKGLLSRSECLLPAAFLLVYGKVISHPAGNLARRDFGVASLRPLLSFKSMTSGWRSDDLVLSYLIPLVLRVRDFLPFPPFPPLLFSLVLPCVHWADNGAFTLCAPLPGPCAQ